MYIYIYTYVYIVVVVDVSEFISAVVHCHLIFSCVYPRPSSTAAGDRWLL